MERDDFRETERDLSDAYLRLRALIPGAYDTPPAPTPEQVWATTEAALRRLLQERITARGLFPPATDDVALRPALSRARRDERERCARHIEAIACHIRDTGPTTAEGLLESLAGTAVGVLLDAAASLRARDAGVREC